MSDNSVNSKEVFQSGLDLLSSLGQGLLRHQQHGPYETWAGGIACPADLAIHGCSSYIILPYSLLYIHKKDEKYLHAAIENLHFTLKHQYEPGYWNNDVTTTWKGVSAFVLMSLAKAYQMLAPLGVVGKSDLQAWYKSIDQAAIWLKDNLDLKMWNINYIVSGAFAVRLAYEVTGNIRFKLVAEKWIQAVLSKINEDGLIWGEMVESDDCPEMSIDPAYNLEMSIPALALYGILANNKTVKQAALRVLRSHLKFLMPDGSLDVGWGIRGYKWTYAGSRTAHGLLMGLMSLSQDMPELLQPIQAHIKLLNSMTKDGILGNGPHFHNQDRLPYCMIPSIVKATGLAFGLLHLPKAVQIKTATAQTDVETITHLKNPNVILFRSNGFSGSISCVHYRAGKPIMRSSSPTGGALSYLCHSKIGRVQLSSQSFYERVELINMQEVPDAGVSTPRLEWHVKNKTFSNLFDFEAAASVTSRLRKNPSKVVVQGCLKNRACELGNISYRLEYVIKKQCIRKQYEITGNVKPGKIVLVEPLITEPGDKIELNKNIVSLSRGKHKIVMTIKTNKPVVPKIYLRRKTWVPSPGVWASPIEIQFVPNRCSDLHKVDIELFVNC